MPTQNGFLQRLESGLPIMIIGKPLFLCAAFASRIMIFPNLALWSSNSDGLAQQAADKIDRSIEDRQHRMTIGLSIDSGFENVSGSLLVTKGRGKFTRLEHSVAVEREIPSAIRETCLRFSQGSNRDTMELSLVQRDLAEVQSALVNRLKASAGKYVDRILAVAVCDPGIWTTDYDNSPVYRGFCNANALAESSGISVIDEFPARDLVVGGSGRPLAAFPVWMLFADRSRTVASKFRSLLVVDQTQVQQFDLPPSDGLDAELPDVGYQVTPLSQWSGATKPRLNDSINHEWIVACEADRTAETADQSKAETLSSIASQLTGEVLQFESLVGQGTCFEALIAATLGLFHIDQLPANLPHLTGADSQRILGRLTPGRPTNWRQLIRAMSQYQPAPMKLKDAV